MNHCVPDFEFQIHNNEEEEYPIHISNSKKPSMQNDEIMELLWQNGQVVMQSQNNRPFRKPPPPARNSGVIPARGIRVENYTNQQHLFMQEDEMASWLHGSIDEDPALDHRDFCADMLFHPPPPAAAVNGGQNRSGVVQASTPAPPVAPRPPIPPPKKVQNFAYFSKHGDAKGEAASAAAATRELTVVDSCETPIVAAAAGSRLSETVRSSPESGRGSLSAAGIAGTFDMTVTSSPGGSSGSAELGLREPVVDRKRKSREPEESEFQSEDVDFESPEAKKQGRGAKKSRAAEIHNLSERKRRDRINEKMKALQELIPRCNKSDKASMLDEAIEYLKSLQLQVQMMSMGCGMMPMMFPGVQQYMPPPMGMGIGMGMGMGMEMGMGMNRPVMPFPNMLAANSAMPAAAAAAAAHLGPRFPVPPFHMPHVPAAPDSSRTQPLNQSDHVLNSFGTLPTDQSRIPNFTDPYQQYLGPNQVQLQLMQAMNQLNVSKPSTIRGQENPEKHQ